MIFFNLFIGALGASRAWALWSESVFTLPPMIIEGEVSEKREEDELLNSEVSFERSTLELEQHLELETTPPPHYEKESLFKLEQPISSTVGSGAKTMDATFNELGVPYFNMNQEEDLALERQLHSQWLISPTSISTQSLEALPFFSTPSLDASSSFSTHRQIHWESAENFSVLRGRIQVPIPVTLQTAIPLEAQAIESKTMTSTSSSSSSSTSTSPTKSVTSGYSKTMTNGYEVEAGTRRDQRWLEYRNPGANAFDLQKDSVVEKLRNFHDQSFFKITRIHPDRNWMVDGDSVRKEVHLGSKVTGLTSIQQLGLSGRKNISSDIDAHYEMVVYLKARRGEFESLDIKNDSNFSQNRQLGAILKWKFLPLESFIEAGLSHEHLQRDYQDHSRIQMQRYQLELLGTHQRQFSYFAVKGHLRSQGARDKIQQNFQQWDSALEQSSSQFYHDQRAEPFTLDTGIEVTTLAQPESLWNLGLKTQWRRYRLLPTPTQKWGDGMSLVGNDQLPSEEGTRVAAGVWFEQSQFHAELLPFYEQTQNEPVILAVSPQTAKTLGLGSVYARGVELHLRQELARWSIDFIYSYQEAVNNSRISWQRGHALPSRPNHSLQTSLSFGKPTQGFHFGMNYGYKSQEALDLSGLWKRAPHHDLKGFLGYGTRAWTVQLIGSQLLSSLNDSPLSLQQGMAGYDLMDPKIENKEYQLLCEFFL